jgi:hypothetical protein
VLGGGSQTDIKRRAFVNRGTPRELAGGNRGVWPRGNSSVKSDDGMEPSVTRTKSAATSTTARGAATAAAIGTAAMASATEAAPN